MLAIKPSAFNFNPGVSQLLKAPAEGVANARRAPLNIKTVASSTMKVPGFFGIGAAVVGLALLLLTFYLGYGVFLNYQGATPTNDLATSMGTLLYAAIQALFLGIMGWVGSLLMLRGIDFTKVDRGVGVVTFKVDKGIGIMTQQPEEEKKPT